MKLHVCIYIDDWILQRNVFAHHIINISHGLQQHVCLYTEATLWRNLALCQHGNFLFFFICFMYLAFFVFPVYFATQHAVCRRACTQLCTSPRRCINDAEMQSLCTGIRLRAKYAMHVFRLDLRVQAVCLDEDDEFSVDPEMCFSGLIQGVVKVVQPVPCTVI